MDSPVSQDPEVSRVNQHSGVQEHKAKKESLACLEWMALPVYQVNQVCQE